MVRPHHVTLVAILGLLPACQEVPTRVDGPPESFGPRYSVSGADRNGAGVAVRFLPPLDRRHGGSGAFDPTLLDRLSVRICVLRNGGCDADAGAVAEFTATSGPGDEVLRLDVQDRHYVAVWDTRTSSLKPGRAYRIEVRLQGVVLGFADVRMAAPRASLRNTGRHRYAVVRKGRAVPIRFRVRARRPRVVRVDPGAADRLPFTFPTVRQALDTVRPGGLVLVADGTHVVRNLSITKPVTIRAEGRSAEIVGQGADWLFEIGAEGRTTIRGLHLSGATEAVVIVERPGREPYDRVLIDRVRIAVDSLGSGIAVRPPAFPPNGRRVVIRNSTILGGWRGVEVGEGVPHVRVIRNIFTGSEVPGSSALIYSRGSRGLVARNLFTDCPQGCINVGGADPTSGRFRVVGNRIVATFEKPSINPIVASGAMVVVRANTVEGQGGGMLVDDDTTWPIPSNAILVEFADTVEVSENTIRNAWVALNIESQVGIVRGLDNVFDGSRTALQVVNVRSLELHSSDFTNYLGIGIHVRPDVVDLTCNWWGTPDGLTATAHDPAIYTPWATEPVAGTSTTTCSGGT